MTNYYSVAAMGGGWVEIAKKSADETDFPPLPEDTTIDDKG